MIRRAVRVLPLLAVALMIGALSAGSFAIAHDDRRKGDDERAQSGNDVRRFDGSCRDHGYSAWDQEWLMMSIEGDLFEIQGGRLAQQKATTEKVRELGAVLVKDHTRSLMEAVDLAKRLGIEVPNEPSPSQQWELRAVAKFSGKEFDRQYADLEIQDHLQDIQEAQDEVDMGCNRDVRENAEDDIPVLRHHLKLAQDALAAVK